MAEGKKWSVGKIIGVAVLCSVGACGGCAVIGAVSKFNAEKAPTSATKATDSRADMPPAPAAKSIGLKEEFKLGEFTYAVTTVGKTASIKNGLGKELPSPGAVFLVVRYTERNDGSETHRGLGAPFNLVDGKGRKFDPSSKAQTALVMAGGDVDLIPELQPGISKEGITAFEVPEDAVASPFKLVVNERGWGGGHVEIAVSP